MDVLTVYVRNALCSGFTHFKNVLMPLFILNNAELFSYLLFQSSDSAVIIEKINLNFESDGDMGWSF